MIGNIYYCIPPSPPNYEIKSQKNTEIYWIFGI